MKELFVNLLVEYGEVIGTAIVMGGIRCIERSYMESRFKKKLDDIRRVNGIGD